MAFSKNMFLSEIVRVDLIINSHGGLLYFAIFVIYCENHRYVIFEWEINWTVRDNESQFYELNVSCFQLYIDRLETKWKMIRNNSCPIFAVEQLPWISSTHKVWRQNRNDARSDDAVKLCSSFLQWGLSIPALVSIILERPQGFLFESAFTQHEVYKKLCSIDGSKGPWSDGLQPSFIKACSASLAEPRVEGGC